MHWCSKPSAALILLAVAGCSQSTIPTQPTLLLDISTIGCWGQGGCSALADGGLFTGNYIGSAPQQSVQLQNKSSANVTITSITQSGDSVFTWALSQDADAGTLPLTIPGLKEAFLQVIFAPKQVKPYSGSLTIASNAVQTTLNGVQTCGPSCLITLAGAGLQTPAPVLAFLSPTGGSQSGGTPVVLSGDHFFNGATVDFGGSPCSNPVVTACSTTDCQESISCTTTRHAPGTVNVTVTDPNGLTSFDAGGTPVTYYYCTDLPDGGCQ